MSKDCQWSLTNPSRTEGDSARVLLASFPTSHWLSISATLWGFVSHGMVFFSRGTCSTLLSQNTQACSLFLQTPIPVKEGPEPHSAMEIEELGSTILGNASIGPRYTFWPFPWICLVLTGVGATFVPQEQCSWERVNSTGCKSYSYVKR